jgi:hypothetical protein
MPWRMYDIAEMVTLRPSNSAENKEMKKNICFICSNLAVFVPTFYRELGFKLPLLCFTFFVTFIA